MSRVFFVRIIQYNASYKWQNDTIIKIVDVRYIICCLNIWLASLVIITEHENCHSLNQISLLWRKYFIQQIINKMIRRHNVHNKELYDLDTDTGPCLPSQWRNWGSGELTFLDLGPEPCCHCQDNPAGGHILPDPDMSVIVDDIFRVGSTILDEGAC